MHCLCLCLDWNVHVKNQDPGINLGSFFLCNQLTATSYIYQSLGDVEWYVIWSSRHDNHEARLSPPPGPAHPSLLWETPVVWGTVGCWDRGWQVGRRSRAPGHLEDSCGSLKGLGFLSVIPGPLGNVVFSFSGCPSPCSLSVLWSKSDSQTVVHGFYRNSLRRK